MSATTIDPLPVPEWVPKAEDEIRKKVAKEADKDFLELRKAGEKPFDYIQMRRDLDGWGNFESETFLNEYAKRELNVLKEMTDKATSWKDVFTEARDSGLFQIPDAAKTAAEMVNIAAKTKSEKEEFVEEYKRTVEENPLPMFDENPIAQIAVGGIQGLANLSSAFVARPIDVIAGTNYADEMNRDLGTAEEALQAADKTWLNKHLRGAASSITQMLIGDTAGKAIKSATKLPWLVKATQYSPNATAAIVRGNQAWTEGKDAGLDGSALAAYAGAQAAAEFVFSAAMSKAANVKGLGWLAGAEGGVVNPEFFRKSFGKGLGEAVKIFGKSTAAELTEEEMTTFTQLAIDRLSGVNPDALSSETMMQAAFDTAIQTVLVTGGIHGANFTSAFPELRQNQKSQKAFEAFGRRFGLKEDAVNRVLENAAKAQSKGRDYNQALARGMQAEYLKTPQGAKAWAVQNQEKAKQLSGIEQPTRKDFEAAGLPKVGAEDRAAFTKNIRENLTFPQKQQKQDIVPEENKVADSQTVDATEAVGKTVDAKPPKPDEMQITAKNNRKYNVKKDTPDEIVKAVENFAGKKPKPRPGEEGRLVEEMEDADVDEALSRSNVPNTYSNRQYAEDADALPHTTAVSLEGLQIINDATNSHDAGDAFLENFGEKLGEMVKSGKVYHIGGPKFAIRAESEEQLKYAIGEMYRLHEDHVIEIEEGREFNDRFAKKIADMTPEEKRVAALTDEGSGLPNERAFEEARRKTKPAKIAYIDGDSWSGLKNWVAERDGVAAANEIIDTVVSEIGMVAKEMGLDLYRLHGDEFAMMGDESLNAEGKLDELGKRAIIKDESQGKEWTYVPKFSVGLGNTKESADAHLGQRKEERKAAGQRAEKGAPPVSLSGPATGKSGSGTQTDISKRESDRSRRQEEAETAEATGRDRTDDVGRGPEEAGTSPAGEGRTAIDPATGLPLHKRTVKSRQVHVDPKRFQHRRNIDPKTGIEDSNKLTGDVDATKLDNFLLFEDTEGKLWVVGGHHRHDRVQRSGRARQYDSWVMREEDGWTPELARAAGAERNIAAGHGKVEDFAAYFREMKLSKKDAELRGILRGELGKQGFDIASNATENTYDLFMNGRISGKAAQAIANAAPGEEAVQDTVSRHYLQNETKISINQLKIFSDYVAKKSIPTEGGGLQQNSLFGGQEDTANLLNQMARESKIAVAKAKNLRSEANALKGAAKKPDVLAKYGIKVDDPDSLKRKVAELNHEANEWAEFWKYPEKVKEIRGPGGLFDSDRDDGTPSVGSDASYFHSDMPESGLLMDSESNEPNPMIFGMQDMLELLSRANANLPKVMAQLSRKRAQGLFRPSTGGIELRADIFIGPLIDTGLASRAYVDIIENDVMGRILEENPKLKPEDIEIRKEPDRRTGKIRISFYRKDPSFARKVMAHEVGHWDDFMPDENMGRGNILGRLGKLKLYFKKSLDKIPADPSQALKTKEREKIRREAEKKAGKKPKKGTKSYNEWKKTAQKTYAEMIRKEIRDRGLITQDQLMGELKKLSVWWKPFNRHGNPKYTRYRFSSPELYADAISVLLNNPAALKKLAPTFYHSYFQYMERNPEVKAAYDSITNEIRAGASGSRTRARVREAFREGDEAHRLELEKKQTRISTIRDTFGTLFADRFYKLSRLVNRTKKTGRKVNPMDMIDVARYSGSQIEYYVGQISNDVGKYLEDHNLTETDLGEYLQYLRAINERSQMANPLTGDIEGAKKALNAMKAEMGPEAMKVLEEARKRFRKIREELILDNIKKAGIYDEKLTRQLLDNEYYATFEVVDYIDRSQGNGAGAKIFKQIGTLKGISNPVSATMTTDISLLRSLNWNQAKVSVVSFLKEFHPEAIEEASASWTGKKQGFLDPQERGKGLLEFMQDGQLKGYYVDSGIANGFAHEYNEDFGAAVKVLRAFAAPTRMWFTNIRPGFQLFNVFFRDPMRTIKNLPGLGTQPWALYKELYTALKAIGNETIRGIPDPTMTEMRERGLLISWSNISGLDDHDTQTERIFAKYSDADQWQSEIANPFRKWFSRMLLIGNIGEHANKRAAYIYLKKNQSRLGWTDEQIDHAVRHWAGSPSFITGGSATPLTNNLFLFSNAMIQGWRSDIEAFSADKKAVAAKTLAYSVMPKMVMLSLSTGALAMVLRAMGADDDDEVVKWADSMKEIYDRISSYDMTNYTCVPLGLTGDNKAVYLRVPQDETGRVVGGLFYKLLSDDRKGLAELAKNAVRYMGDQGPGLNPMIECVGNTLQYLTGVNPYDTFRERNAIPETEWKAGGWPAHKAFGKWLWNNYGGSFIYRFRSDNPVAAKSEVEDFLQLPFMGDLAGRFVKVSDYGLVEKAETARVDAQQKRAQTILSVRDAVRKDLAGEDLSKDEQQLLLEESRYADRYREMLQKRGGEQVQRIMDMGQTDEEKKAILDALFGEKSEDPEVQQARDRFMGKQLYSLTSPEPDRRKGESEEDHQKRQARHRKKLEDARLLMGEVEMDEEKATDLLRAEYKKRGYSTRIYSRNHKLTTFGKRLRRLREHL